MSAAPHPSVDRVLRSFRFAGRGLRYLVQTQPNVRVHLFLGLAAIGLGFALQLSGPELSILALTIGLVLVAEAFNSAIELIVDLVTPDFHELAGRAKDVSAAGVLIAALVAVAVAASLFLPRLGQIFRG